jgi:hypothetical protein
MIAWLDQIDDKEKKLARKFGPDANFIIAAPFPLPLTTSMAGNRKRSASTTISKKASGAKKRLLALIGQDVTNESSLPVPNDRGTEAGFRDVRTAEQKGDLLRWVVY